MKKCFICNHDKITKGFTNKMFDGKGNILIIKEIPSLVCENCGEVYFKTDIMKKLEQLLDQNVCELEIINYQKKVALQKMQHKANI